MKADKRPSRLALSNWPVRWKMLAIVAVPLVLAGVFGGARIYSSAAQAVELRRATDRADIVPAVVDYLASLEETMVAATDGGDIGSALTTFDSRKAYLQQQLAVTEVPDGVRLATNTLLDDGQDLLGKIMGNAADLQTRVMSYEPLLITAETAITGLVASDTGLNVRSQGDALSSAVGARGQMTMQQMLVNRGGDLPEPELRSLMVTLAGAEPPVVATMGAFLGDENDRAAALRSAMVARMLVLSDPQSVLVGNPELLASQQITRGIADGLIAQTAESIPGTVEQQANDARSTAIRDAALVVAALLVTLLLVTVVARSLVRPLRTLRDSALKVAHDDLAREVEQVRRDGKPISVQPIPIHTSEEIGQVAHAVDALHEQAVQHAGDQARLQFQVTDMFETLSRRNRSLVDQQLALIDHLEREEADPHRLDSLFRLDHLAAQMRRNGANLQVLAGVPLPREQAGPVSITALVKAAASEVEDYPRIATGSLPDSAIAGPAASDLVHLIAELLDNALRYSPPSSQVTVSVVHTGTGGLVIEVADTGLGMTESDLRIANTRLQSGGEVNSYTARHMGLFVVGRLGAGHGLVVRLRSTVPGEPGSGITAGVYVPAEQLIATRELVGSNEPGEDDLDEQILDEPRHLGPRASGNATNAGGPVESAELDELPVHPSVAAFFARSSHSAPQRPTPLPAGDGDPDDAIYQNMLSEWLVDPHEVSHSPDLNWQTVWDHGWSAAGAAESAPVLDYTEEGLPVRRPGARLVPGAADSGVLTARTQRIGGGDTE